MGYDAILKRFSPFIICLMIAAIAYFQAVGIGQLVSMTILTAGAPSPGTRADAHLPARVVDHDHHTSADLILARNPFDSVTGPLIGKTLPGVDPPGGEGLQTDRDPYADPPCGSARALLIASSDDPAWSFAAIAGQDGKPVLRRRGEEIDGQTVLFVGDLRPAEHRHLDEGGLWDRVWLTSGAMRCQLVLGAKAPMAKGAPPPPSTPGAPPGSFASKVRKTGEHEYDVDRSAVDALIGNPAELMKARITPAKEGDRVVGMNMFGIRPGTALAAIGLENGDRLTAINGFEMNDPQKMLEAYSKLLRADHLSVSVVRGGRPMNLDYNIK